MFTPLIVKCYQGVDMIFFSALGRYQTLNKRMLREWGSLPSRGTTCSGRGMEKGSPGWDLDHRESRVIEWGELNRREQEKGWKKSPCQLAEDLQWQSWSSGYSELGFPSHHIILLSARDSGTKGCPCILAFEIWSSISFFWKQLLAHLLYISLSGRLSTSLNSQLVFLDLWWFDFMWSLWVRTT